MTRADAQPRLTSTLLFDPCYMSASGTVVLVCNYRVGTFGCMIAAAFCALLAVMFAVWALRHHRNPHYTWGNYYFCALTHFVACRSLPCSSRASSDAVAESLGGVVTYGLMTGKWNSNRGPSASFNVQVGDGSAVQEIHAHVIQGVVSVRRRRLRCVLHPFRHLGRAGPA